MTTWIIHSSTGGQVVHHSDRTDDESVLYEYGVRIGLLGVAHQIKADSYTLWLAFAAHHGLTVQPVTEPITKKRSMRTRLKMRDQLIAYAEAVAGLPPSSTPLRRARTKESARQRLKR
jgi:hypothetical protein